MVWFFTHRSSQKTHILKQMGCKIVMKCVCLKGFDTAFSFWNRRDRQMHDWGNEKHALFGGERIELFFRGEPNWATRWFSSWIFLKFFRFDSCISNGLTAVFQRNNRWWCRKTGKPFENTKIRVWHLFISNNLQIISIYSSIWFFAKNERITNGFYATMDSTPHNIFNFTHILLREKNDIKSGLRWFSGNIT